MAVKSSGFSPSRAIDFYKKNAIYFGIGKSSAWDDEINPPAETSSTPLYEPIGYRKADKSYLVIPYDGSPVPAGTTIIDQMDGSQWKVVSEADSIAYGAGYAYIETTIFPSDFPLGDYRQVAVFTGLVRNSDVDQGKFNLQPFEVSSTGILELIDNRQKSTRNIDSREFLSFVIKF